MKQPFLRSIKNWIKKEEASTTDAPEKKDITIKRKITFKEWKILKKQNARPRYKTPCLVCRADMYVSPGQIQYFHKECRARGRSIFSKDIFRLKA